MEDSEEEHYDSKDKPDDSKFTPSVDWEEYFDNNIVQAKYMKHHNKNKGNQ